MKRLSLALAVLGLMCGLATAQNNVSPRSDIEDQRATSDRDTQRGAVKATDVDEAQTQRAADREIEDRDLTAGKGTGVATGFVAAGIGLALLGLFVRRRNRRHGHYHDEDRHGGRLPPRV